MRLPVYSAAGTSSAESHARQRSRKRKRQQPTDAISEEAPMGPVPWQGQMVLKLIFGKEHRVGDPDRLQSRLGRTTSVQRIAKRVEWVCECNMRL
jgi:hypothetical protein